MKTGLNSILLQAINLEELVKTNPELFNLDCLDIYEKVELLRADFKFFGSRINVSAFSPSDKAHILLNVENKRIAALVKLSDDELEKMPNNKYGELVKKHFRDYIRKERFPKMLKADQQEVFLNEPEWVIENVDKPPRLTSERLRNLARKKPAFIDSYIADFGEFSTDSDFWIAMILYDKKYQGIFLRNTKKLITKTGVRSVIWSYPELIKLIDGDILADSKLTVKEWVLLINHVMASREKVFDGWEFSDDLIEIFKMDLIAEFLNGKSTPSVRFQKAMKGVFNKDKDTEDED